MDVLGKARRLESTIAAKLDEAAKGFGRSAQRVSRSKSCSRFWRPWSSGSSQPAAARACFRSIESSCRAVAPSREARGRLEAVFAADTPLRTRILDRVQSAGCSPADVVVESSIVDHAEPNWSAPEFDLQFARVAEPEVDGRELEPHTGQIDIRVLCGVMERWAYSFTAPRIDVGRGAEVRDHPNRLIRTNHVVFTEGAGDVNQTVSRTACPHRIRAAHRPLPTAR